LFFKKEFLLVLLFFKYVTNDNATIYVGGNKNALRPQIFFERQQHQQHHGNHLIFWEILNLKKIDCPFGCFSRPQRSRERRFGRHTAAA